MKKTLMPRLLARLAPVVPALFALHQVGCLPEGSFQTVLAENIVFTFAVVVNSITSVIFNQFFTPFV